MAQYHSDAGKKGWLLTKDKLYLRFKVVKDKYESSPKLCKYCGHKIPYESKRQDYCNRVCWNNSRWGKERLVTPRVKSGKLKKNVCTNCGKPCLRLYCSRKCERIYKFREKSKEGIYITGSTIRGYLKLIEKTWMCDMCGLIEWNGEKIPLEVHHNDGNHMNNSDNNLKYHCPNCHSLTKTYRGKNRGNGRMCRRVNKTQLSND